MSTITRVTQVLVLYTVATALSSPKGFAQVDERVLQDTSLDSLLNLPVSTAAKYAQRRTEAPASITIVTSDEITRYGYRTLEDVFRNVRGFYVSNDRNYSYIGVRGFSRPTDYNNRILLLIDGHTLNENFYGAALIGTEFGHSLDFVDRIEIVRGPGSALYGTGAMFAVVNIISKQGSAIDGLKFSGEVGGDAKRSSSAMFGREFASGVSIAVSGTWTDVAGGDIYFSEFDDPSLNNGLAVNLDWDRYYAVHGSVRYGDLAVRAALSSRRKGIPTAAWEMNFNDPGAETLDELRFIELKYEREIAVDKRLTVRAYGDQYSYWGAYPYETIFYERSKGDWIGSEVRFRWDPRPSHRIVVGAEVRRSVRAEYSSWDADGTYFGGNFPFNLYSLFVQDELQVMEDLAVTVGIRSDRYSTAGGATTPRAAVVYHPGSSSTLKFLYGRAFRAPNAWERNYHDQWGGFVNNPALGAERIHTTELVFEQRLSRGVFGSASIFRYHMDGLIDQVEVETPDSLLGWDPTVLQYNNTNDVETVGLEVELTASPGAGVLGYASYTFQHAEDVLLNTTLTNSPKHLLKFGLSAPVATYFSLGANFSYDTNRRTVQDTQTDSYFLADLTVSSSPLFHHLGLSASVKNLFDTTYQTPGGFEHLQGGIVQPGRQLLIEVRYGLWGGR